MARGYIEKMQKAKKIEFINRVYLRFADARNHGSNGNSWWYPKANVIAYNVKVYSWLDMSEVRKNLTIRQNDFYSDNELSEIASENQNDEARMFSDDIDSEYGVKSGYAGRSGGWLEVEYPSSLQEVDKTSEEIDYYYQQAKELEELEATISQKIEKALAGYKKYIGSPQAAKDFADNLLSDEDIADIYKGKAKNLLDKLN